MFQVADLSARDARGERAEEVLGVARGKGGNEKARQAELAPDDELQVLDVVGRGCVVVRDAAAYLLAVSEINIGCEAQRGRDRRTMKRAWGALCWMAASSVSPPTLSQNLWCISPSENALHTAKCYRDRTY